MKPWSAFAFSALVLVVTGCGKTPGHHRKARPAGAPIPIVDEYTVQHDDGVGIRAVVIGAARGAVH